MGVSVKSSPAVLDGTVAKTEVEDSTQEQRDVTVDGYTFHFSPNFTRNFLDDSVGQRAAAFRDDGIEEDGRS